MVQCGSDVNSDLCNISDTSKHLLKARGQSRDSHQYFLSKCWKTGAWWNPLMYYRLHDPQNWLGFRLQLPSLLGFSWSPWEKYLISASYFSPKWGEQQWSPTWRVVITEAKTKCVTVIWNVLCKLCHVHPVTHTTDWWGPKASCFSSSHVQLWESDHKEGWVLTDWCFWIGVMEKTLESPLDSEAIKPVHPKGNQSWIFIGRTDAEAEALILWPPDVKSRLIGKDPDAGKDWRQEEKKVAENEMVR